jgi:hypothetical protein
MEGWGGPSRVESSAEEAQTRVLYSLAEREDPLHYRGRLLGFVERFGVGREGILALDLTHLRLLPTATTPPLIWPLEDLRSLQSSSSFLQITDTQETVVLLEFPEDSPRRWDEVLRGALQSRWSALGRGVITEYQPRIRTR